MKESKTYAVVFVLCVSNECRLHRLFFLLFGMESTILDNFALKKGKQIEFSITIYVCTGVYPEKALMHSSDLRKKYNIVEIVSRKDCQK